MRLCILCEDSKVELARENSKVILVPNDNPKPVLLHPGLQAYKEILPKGHLSIPVSETGELSATHWFCFLNVTQEGYDQLLSIQEHSIIEEGSPKEFLSKWNLKIIN